MQTQQLILSLAKRGIDTFFIAPGSRNYELIEAIGSVRGVTSHVHYDERGLAFFALGYALSTRKTAALVVTSGTAVGLLLPAVMEAYHSGVNLLLLTADRPALLRGSGANQTCDQRGIFSNFTTLELDLDLTIPAQFDPEEIAETILTSSLTSPGPIHLNCQLKNPAVLRFPIVTKEESEKEDGHPSPSKQQQDLLPLVNSFLEDPEALLLIGRNFPFQNRDSLKSLQIKTSCKVITDLLSNCRGLFSEEIPLQKFIQQNKQASRILHLGGSFIDTTLLSYIEKQTLSEYIQISPESLFFDPQRKVTQQIAVCPWDLIQRLAIMRPIAPDHSSSDQPGPSTLSLQSQFLQSLLLQKDERIPIYISNSTLIRDFDQFYYPSEIGFHFYSNRGLSGNDGTLATFAGICLGSNQSCMGFLGDIAFLHDISSLPLLNQLSNGGELFLFNNYGGDIFRKLNHSKNSLFLETHYATKHPYHLNRLVDGYGFTCIQVFDVEDLKELSSPSVVNIWEIDVQASKSTQKEYSLTSANSL